MPRYYNLAAIDVRFISALDCFFKAKSGTYTKSFGNMALGIFNEKGLSEPKVPPTDQDLENLGYLAEYLDRCTARDPSVTLKSGETIDAHLKNKIPTDPEFKAAVDYLKKTFTKKGFLTNDVPLFKAPNMTELEASRPEIAEDFLARGAVKYTPPPKVDVAKLAYGESSFSQLDANTKIDLKKNQNDTIDVIEVSANGTRRAIAQNLEAAEFATLRGMARNRFEKVPAMAAAATGATSSTAVVIDGAADGALGAVLAPGETAPAPDTAALDAVMRELQGKLDGKK
jgi:hypothetical protein